jgi:hypothetical protein
VSACGQRDVGDITFLVAMGEIKRGFKNVKKTNEKKKLGNSPFYFGASLV